MSPLCNLIIARPGVRMPDTPCGRVMVHVGDSMRKNLPVWACPRCDAADAMPSRKEMKRK